MALGDVKFMFVKCFLVCRYLKFKSLSALVLLFVAFCVRIVEHWFFWTHCNRTSPSVMSLKPRFLCLLDLLFHVFLNHFWIFIHWHSSIVKLSKFIITRSALAYLHTWNEKLIIGSSFPSIRSHVRLLQPPLVRAILEGWFPRDREPPSPHLDSFQNIFPAF